MGHSVGSNPISRFRVKPRCDGAGADDFDDVLMSALAKIRQVEMGAQNIADHQIGTGSLYW